MTQEALKHVLYLLNKPDTARQSENVRLAEDFIKEALAQTEQDGECKYCTDGCPACDARRQSNVLP